MSERNASSVSAFISGGINFATIICLLSIPLTFYYLNRRRRQKDQNKLVKDSTPSLVGKTAIVTGANTGIGFATAMLLAQSNATVILACRNRQRGNEAVAKIIKTANNSKVTCELLDVTDLQSIREFAARIEQCHIFVNNAGAMFAKQESIHGIEKTFFTNHLGNFLLLEVLLPVLIKTSVRYETEVRVISIGSRSEGLSTLGAEYRSKGTSAFGRLVNGPSPYKQWEAYGTSKLCNMMCNYELDRRLKAGAYNELLSSSLAGKEKIMDPSCPPSPPAISRPSSSSSTVQHPRVTVNIVAPGLTDTDILRTAPTWKKILTWPVRKLMLVSSEQAAEGIVWAAVHKELSGISGKYFMNYVEVSSSPTSYLEQLALDLWAESERLIASFTQSDTSSK